MVRWAAAVLAVCLACGGFFTFQLYGFYTEHFVKAPRWNFAVSVIEAGDGGMFRYFGDRHLKHKRETKGLRAGRYTYWIGVIEPANRLEPLKTPIGTDLGPIVNIAEVAYRFSANEVGTARLLAVEVVTDTEARTDKPARLFFRDSTQEVCEPVVDNHKLYRWMGFLSVRGMPLEGHVEANPEASGLSIVMIRDYPLEAIPPGFPKPVLELWWETHGDHNEEMNLALHFDHQMVQPNEVAQALGPGYAPAVKDKRLGCWITKRAMAGATLDQEHSGPRSGPRT
jgi:hypothetical protein